VATNFPSLAGKEKEINTLGKVAAQLTRLRRNGFTVDGFPLLSPHGYVSDSDPNSPRSKVTTALVSLGVDRGYIEFVIFNRVAKTTYDMYVNW
jgi:hypothetical protein